jgi:uncharacterized membrane protein
MSDDKVSTWRIVLAAILDFLTAFFGIGFAVAALTGGLTGTGFALNGLPALLVILLIVLYFWGFPRLFGARIWEGILKAKR